MAKVLVIEDNPVNMKLACFLLGNAGHTVWRARDAEAGLAQVAQERPDLILMDFQLPGMDGLAATVLLKQNPATAAIPIIALTALAMKTDQDKSRAAGCDAYIAKPLRYQELYAAMNTLLSQQTPALVSPAPALAQAGAVHGVRNAAAGALDVAVLRSLVGDDPAVIQEFLAAFRINAQKIAGELKVACAQEETVEAGKLAHKLKSAAHTVGARALGRLCADMETAGKAGNSGILQALWPVFEAELGLVNGALASLLPPLPSSRTP